MSSLLRVEDRGDTGSALGLHIAHFGPIAEQFAAELAVLDHLCLDLLETLIRILK